MPIQSVLAEGPAGSADVSELFVQATSSFTFSLRAWPASIAAVWIACPHVEVKTRSGIARSLVASLRAKAQLAASLHAAFVSAWPARQSDVAQAKVLLNQCCVHSTLTVHRRQCWLDSQFVKRCSMGFRDPFQYRTRSQIDKGWPDLHTGSREWNLKKIYKVKTSCLKLMLNIKELFDVRMDTVWLSQLYFQRYFSQNSFQANTAVVFVTACVHLACKANDQPRPLDNVIKKTYRLRYSRDPMESKKIDDIMVFVEYKERVLLAERALLYAFAFDFRNGDPFSFALKYNRLHSADNLVDPDAAETFFAWLTFAGQATTLCLQYPPSLLAVASLWYAQHLSRGQVPKDSNGKEFWENLPVEKQDRVALPAPTAEMIEDMHWQLVPELSEESFRLMLLRHPNGRLPGADCNCKACCVHQAKVEAAASAPAAAQAEDSTGAADAAVRQAQPADPAIGVMPSSAGIMPLAACMEDKRYTGASSPRTGTTDSAPNRHAVTPSSAIPGPSVAPPDVQLSNAAPPRHHRPASAPPAASTSASQAVHWAGPSGSNSNAHASPSQRAQRAPNGQLQHLQPRANGHGELSITPNGHVNDRLSLPNGNSPPSDRPAGLGHNPHEQGNAAPAVVQQQNGHQQADVNGDDDGLEEGEIEEGEVLPDGTVAGATSSAAVNGSMHDGDHNNLTDGSRASMLTNGIRKRSAAPESPDASSLHAAKRRAVQS